MSQEKRCCPTDAPPVKCDYAGKGDDMYVVGPVDAKAGILVVSDIFGMRPANSKRFPDQLAESGFLVVMPDFFGDDAWPESEWPPASWEDPKWLEFHASINDLDRHRPMALRAIALLKRMGCTKIGLAGFCWGGLLTFDLSSSQSVDAAATAHPAFMTSEIIASARTPVCLLPSLEETDYDKIEEAFRALTVEPKVYKHYHSLHHGFLANRYDPETYTPAELKDCVEAKGIVVDFFKSTLL